MKRPKVAALDGAVSIEPATSFSDVTHDGVVSCNRTTTRTRRSR